MPDQFAFSAIFNCFYSVLLLNSAKNNRICYRLLLKHKKVLKAARESTYFKNVSYENGSLTFKIRVQLSLALNKMA
jgi:hypothetical protein